MSQAHTSSSLILHTLTRRRYSQCNLQTIKRTSEYEKGHPWVCNLCNKENRALMMACKCCGRPKRYFVKRSRPAHGLRFADSMRSLQSNYIFKDAHDEVNVMDDGKWTPLHNAAVAANPGLIESLLNNGAVIEAKTLAGFRPLHLACRSRSLKCVEALIHFGAKVCRGASEASRGAER